ncbi:MAG: hypothetical protein NT039_04500 [Candidatus Berkelbacteria bacterium]|nr:hypothetical protein [Candidatus Berkelbacteria bacterium]
MAKERQKKIDIPPLYVLKIIPDKNILVVGENKDVFQKGLTISQINWLDSSLSHFVGERKTLAQIRYQHTPKPCSISYLNNESDPACGGASGRVRWQSGSSAASMTQSRRSLCRGCAIGLHPRSKPRGIQTIPNKKISVIFKNPERAITPGQSCVFYQQDKVLGGGFIEI